MRGPLHFSISTTSSSTGTFPKSRPRIWDFDRPPALVSCLLRRSSCTLDLNGGYHRLLYEIVEVIQNLCGRYYKLAFFAVLPFSEGFQRRRFRVFDCRLHLFRVRLLASFGRRSMICDSHERGERQQPF